jgi:hypothetical protein
MGIIALLFVFLSSGCRETQPPTEPPLSSVLHLQFKPGDYFGYDYWLFDEYGFPIDSSRFRTSWTIVDTAAQFHGFTGVTLIVDSIFTPRLNGTEALSSVQTMGLKVIGNGDVYQYGFVAGLLNKGGGVTVIPQWDRIAVFSLGTSTSWLVGQGDSTGTTSVYGQEVSSGEYVTITVNGTPHVFLSSRIDITLTNLLHSFRVTDSPTAFLSFDDESSSAVGSIGLLTTLRTK